MKHQIMSAYTVTEIYLHVFLTSSLEMSKELNAPAALFWEKSSWCQWDSRICDSQSHFGRCEEEEQNICTKNLSNSIGQDR